MHYIFSMYSVSLSISVLGFWCVVHQCNGMREWNFIKYFMHLWQRGTPKRHNWAYSAHEMFRSSSSTLSPPSSLPPVCFSLLFFSFESSSASFELRGEAQRGTLVTYPQQRERKRLLASNTGSRYHMRIRKDTSFKMKAGPEKEKKSDNIKHQESGESSIGATFLNI